MFIYSLMVIWIVSILCIVNSAAMNIHASVCVDTCFQLSSVYIPRGRIARSYDNSVVSSIEFAVLFSEVVAPFYVSNLLHSFQHLFIISLVIIIIVSPRGYEVISHYDFGLHFPNN